MHSKKLLCNSDFARKNGSQNSPKPEFAYVRFPLGQSGFELGGHDDDTCAARRMACDRIRINFSCVDDVAISGTAQSEVRKNWRTAAFDGQETPGPELLDVLKKNLQKQINEASKVRNKRLWDAACEATSHEKILKRQSIQAWRAESRTLQQIVLHAWHARLHWLQQLVLLVEHEAALSAMAAVDDQLISDAKRETQDAVAGFILKHQQRKDAHNLQKLAFVLWKERQLVSQQQRLQHLISWGKSDVAKAELDASEKKVIDLEDRVHLQEVVSEETAESHQKALHAARERIETSELDAELVQANIIHMESELVLTMQEMAPLMLRQEQVESDLRQARAEEDELRQRLASLERNLALEEEEAVAHVFQQHVEAQEELESMSVENAALTEAEEKMRVDLMGNFEMQDEARTRMLRELQGELESMSIENAALTESLEEMRIEVGDFEMQEEEKFMKRERKLREVQEELESMCIENAALRKAKEKLTIEAGDLGMVKMDLEQEKSKSQKLIEELRSKLHQSEQMQIQSQRMHEELIQSEERIARNQSLSKSRRASAEECVRRLSMLHHDDAEESLQNLKEQQACRKSSIESQMPLEGIVPKVVARTSVARTSRSVSPRVSQHGHGERDMPTRPEESSARAPQSTRQQGNQGHIQWHRWHSQGAWWVLTTHDPNGENPLGPQAGKDRAAKQIELLTEQLNVSGVHIEQLRKEKADLMDALQFYKASFPQRVAVKAEVERGDAVRSIGSRHSILMSRDSSPSDNSLVASPVQSASSPRDDRKSRASPRTSRRGASPRDNHKTVPGGASPRNWKGTKGRGKRSAGTPTHQSPTKASPTQPSPRIMHEAEETD